MSDTDDDADFEEQIRLHQLEREGKLNLNTTNEEVKKYTDKDGTEYEWDEKQKAYVPKVTDDFIAMYQASYGVSQNDRGQYTYIDPNSKRKLYWKEETKQWYYQDTNVPVLYSSENITVDNKKNEITNNNNNIKAVENDSKLSDPNVEFNFSKRCYMYKDPTTGKYLYEWDQSKEQWILPKNDDDSTHNLQDLKELSQDININNNIKFNKKRKLTMLEKGAPKIQKPAEWFEMDEDKNTNVYVSNLPENITLEEYITFMSKCGIIMEDPITRKPKVKLYTDSQGNFKGDGRCCYLKVESVQLALQILDGFLMKDKIVKVERAKFTLKVNDKNPKEKDPTLLKGQEKLLAWKPDPIVGQRLSKEKTIILKNMFDPKTFDEDAALIIEYQKELREECAKFGLVKKVKIYDRHPEGVASVTFNEFEEADACLGTMNGRFYAGRKIEAERWDGKTKFKIEETEAEKVQRLERWGQFLEDD
ncbi:unnamed protein product [Gordionus sp. m RMFG-2023]